MQLLKNKVFYAHALLSNLVGNQLLPKQENLLLLLLLKKIYLVQQELDQRKLQ